MASGLLFVYTDVGDGPVAEAEYHDWYDHEHGPARLTVPGLTGACRYEAVDDLTPRWLALYELDSPEVLDSAEYKAVVEGGSDRDKFIMSHLPVAARAGRAFGALRTRLPGRGQHAVAGPDRVRRAEPRTPRAQVPQLFQLNLLHA